jgi:hypothetical protein
MAGPVSIAEYAADLLTDAWKWRRHSVLSRDKCKCTQCGRAGGEVGWDRLDVHHLYYVIGKRAWDYPYEALTRLCRDCHTKVHQASKVPFFEEKNGKLVESEWVVCSKCGGVGWFECYKHIADGICFRCWGARGYHRDCEVKPPTAEDAHKLIRYMHSGESKIPF